MKKCVVIGSVNMDMVTRVDQFPRPGETRTGSSFITVPGGKGANQAVALGRLGAPVRMLGKVGDDMFGRQYLQHFAENGVDTACMEVSTEHGTGVAAIEVSDEGENHIVVVPGANGACDMEWLDRVLDKVQDAEIILFQLEIPAPVVFEAIARLKKPGRTIVLDPAPAIPLPDTVLEGLDYITPNETELRVVTGDLPEEAGTEERIAHLLAKGVRNVIHKAGADGAYIARAGEPVVHVPGFRVKVVDTTAAGDTFNAGLSVGLALDMPVEAAVRFANAAAALAVTALGAQGGMPDMEQVKAFMEKKG